MPLANVERPTSFSVVAAKTDDDDEFCDVSATEEPAYVWMPMETILERIGTHRTQIMILIISSICYGHFSVQTLVPTLCTESVWTLWPELESKPVLYNSVFAAGAICRLVGSILLLPLIDRLGRRPFLCGFAIISACVALISAASPNFAVYTTLRAFVLLFTAVLPAASTVYSVEMVTMKRRAIPAMLAQCVATLYVCYAIGIKMALDASSNIPQSQVWRWAQGFMQAPTLIAIVLIGATWLETPRFHLAVKSNRRAACRTLAKMTPGGNEGLRSALELKDQTADQPLEELLRFKGIDDMPRANQSVKKSKKFLGAFQSMITCFRDPDYLKPTVGLVLCWAFQSFAHWGMSTYMTTFFSYLQVNTNWTTFGAYLFQVPVQILLFWAMQSPWGGRVRAIRIGAVVCTIVTLILALCIGIDVKSKALLMTLCIASQAVGGPLWGPIYSYSAERYPTTMRGAAMGLFGAVNAASTVATTYVGSVSLDKTRLWIFPLVWGCLRFGIVLSSFLMDKEVNNRKLEDLPHSISVSDHIQKFERETERY